MSQKQPLSELIRKLAHLEELDESFNPAEVVGDVKDKIDAIKYMIDKWNADADMLDDNWIQPLIQKRNSLVKKAENLKKYLQSQMEYYNFDKLPGQAFRAQLMNKKPTAKITVEPTEDDLITFPDLVEKEVYLSWRNAALAEALTNGRKVHDAKLTKGKSLRFYPIDKG